MANCYTGVSFVVVNEPTKKELDWWTKHTNQDWIKSNGNPPPFDENEVVSFDTHISNRKIFIESENCDIEQLVRLCQNFLIDCPRLKYISFEWANWSEGGYNDRYSGGGVLILPTHQHWFFPITSIRKTIQELELD